MDDHQNLLKAINLSCERDDRRLFEDLSFTVSAGDIWRVEGPNGAGKTTLLRIISGLMPLHQGELFWKGLPLRDQQDDFLQSLLFLGHKTGIKAMLTPFENLQAWCASRFTTSEQAMIYSLEKAGLSGFEHLPCHSLSSGQQRRAALARLHLSGAQLWILDEAFTAIDKQGVAELERWIEDKAKAGGAVVLTTHHSIGGEREIHSLTLGSAV